MTRASSGAGIGRRPNNSLAGVAGSSGFASAGNGCGSSVPLDCALTKCCARKATANANAAARVFCFVVMRCSPRQFAAEQIGVGHSVSRGRHKVGARRTRRIGGRDHGPTGRCPGDARIG